MIKLFIVVVWLCGLVSSWNIISEFLCEPMEYDLMKGKSFKGHINTLSDPMGEKIVWIALLLETFDNGDGTKIIPTSTLSEYFSIDIVINVLNSLLENQNEKFKFKIRRVHLTQQLKTMFISDCYDTNVWFVMGPKPGQEISMWSKVTTTIPMPFLTFGSTQESEDVAKAKLSNEVSQYLEFMFQIHPSETFRHAAILNLLKKFKWDYVSIFFSESSYDHGSDCVNMLKKNGICIANEFSISTDILLEEKLIKMAELSRNKVLVLMTDPADSRLILKMLRKTKLQDRFFLFFTYGSTRIKEIVSGYEDVAEGAVTVDHDYLLDKDDVSEEVLKYHVSELTPQNTKLDFFHLFWEQHFKCRLNSRLLDKSFPDRDIYNVSCDLIEDAFIILNDDAISSHDFIKKSLYGMAMVISKMVREIGYECEKTGQITQAALKQCKNNCTFSDVSCLRVMLGYYLANRESGLNEYQGNIVMFSYFNYRKNEDSYSNEEYTNEMFGFQKFRRDFDKTPTENLKDNIGDFLVDTRFVVLRNNNVSVVPSSSCSQECLPGYWKEYKGPSRSLKCCWICIPCKANSVVINNTCHQCKYFERANHTNKSCQELPIKQMGFEHDDVGLVLGCMSVVGVFFVLVCTFIFVANNNKHVVKSSGRDLNYLIMVAILSLFLANFSFLYKPSYAICIIRMNVPQLAIFVCFSSLLLKTIRLYRIFKTNKTELVSPRLISPGSQIAIVFILSFFQILLTGVPTFKGIHGLEKKVSSNKMYVVLQCQKLPINEGTKFLVDSALSLSSMLTCIFLVLRLRHLPKSYNESRSYAMIAFITFLAVCLFIPLFSVIEETDNYWHEIARCVLGILIGYLVISFFILPRLWSLWRYGDTNLERPTNLTQPLQPNEPNMNVDESMHDQ